MYWFIFIHHMALTLVSIIDHMRYFPSVTHWNAFEVPAADAWTEI